MSLAPRPSPPNVRRLRRLALALTLVTGLLAAPRPAAADTRFELGGNYWLHQGGAFTAMLALDTPVTRWLAVGGRAGGVLTTDPVRGGVPIDLAVRLHVARPVYLELLGGSWLLFDSGQTVRGHVALAIGTGSSSVNFAVELGYLDPEPIFGAKLGFRL